MTRTLLSHIWALPGGHSITLLVVFLRRIFPSPSSGLRSFTILFRGLFLSSSPGFLVSIPLNLLKIVFLLIVLGYFLSLEILSSLPCLSFSFWFFLFPFFHSFQLQWSEAWTEAWIEMKRRERNEPLFTSSFPERMV